MNYSHYLGIDVSKKKLDLTLLDNEGELTHYLIGNNTESIELLISKLEEKHSGFKLQSTLVCMEHTGTYTLPLRIYLYKEKANVWMEAAIKINNSNQMRRGKTDKKDSQRIAIYASRYQNDVVLWQPKREVIEELTELMNQRERLLSGYSRLATPIKELNEMRVSAGLKEQKSAYECTLKRMLADVKKIEKKMNLLIKSDEQCSRLIELTTSVPGVGIIVALQIIIKSNEFKAISESKKFACYAGVVPFEKSSGIHTGRGRVSHLANKKVKTALHMAAISNIAHNTEIQAYYERKVKEGKNKMSVINAIRNKIVKRIFACVRDNRLYEDSYMHSLA